MEKREGKTTEKNYSEEEIMQEIEPIFRDYFIARFRRTQNGIFMKPTNGQIFYISVLRAK